MSDEELEVLREIDVLAEGLAAMAQRAPRITRALIQGIHELTERSEALEVASREAQVRALMAELEPSTPPPAQDHVRELLRLKCLETCCRTPTSKTCATPPRPRRPTWPARRARRAARLAAASTPAARPWRRS